MNNNSFNGGSGDPNGGDDTVSPAFVVSTSGSSSPVQSSAYGFGQGQIPPPPPPPHYLPPPPSMKQEDIKNNIQQEVKQELMKPKQPQQQQQQQQNNSNNSYKSPFVSNYDFLIDEDNDFQLTDSVIWGPDTNTLTDELVAKPKPDRQDDPCGCSRPNYSLIQEMEKADEDPCLSEQQKQAMMNNMMTCNDMSCVMHACLEECRSNCEAGDYCGNKRIQRKQWKQMEVIQTEKKGKGLRVLEDVAKGDLITEYVGKAVNKLFLGRLFRRYANERMLYIMALTNEIYLDARDVGGVARYVNHSCDPNCVVERWKVRGLHRAAVVAKKDIPAGTELSFDYQWERRRGRAPTKCHCNEKLCRQTLEVSRSMDEETMDRRLSQHWKKPLISRAGKEIVNRCVRIFSEEAQEFYPADVVQYDDNTGKHLLLYQHDLDEVWEDLKTENWMMLDEEAEQFIIRKKRKIMSNNANNNNSNGSNSDTPNGVGGNGGGGGGGFLGAAHHNSAGVLMQGQHQLGARANYVYAQTHVKEALINRHLIERCQQSCRVTITLEEFFKDAVINIDEKYDPEYEERTKMLQFSPDGTIWKLTIAGSDVPKARQILEKNIAYITSREATGAIDGRNTPTTKMSLIGGGSAVGGGDHQHGSDIVNGTPVTLFKPVGPADENSAEVVFPRSIVDTVKRRLPELRALCRNVTITFVPSESKSKQFAKLIVEGSLNSDVDKAKEHLWNQLNIACTEHNTPKTPSGVFKDLGILGGSMSSSDFYRLLEYDSRAGLSLSSSDAVTVATVSADAVATTSKLGGIGGSGRLSSSSLSLKQDAKEDLSRWSPFFASFEAAQRCTIWVQSDSDKGHIDRDNRLVNQATPNAPRKLFFGCEPKIIPKLWRQVESRAAEVERGVKYFYLGPDRLYLPQMMQNNGQFFDFVKKVSAASVSIDSMTGDHLRIDGEKKINYQQEIINLSDDSTAGKRAALAEELIRLQIELYRDHCIRHDNWIFGRDWTFAKRSAQKNPNKSLSSSVDNTNSSSITNGTPSRSSFNNNNNNNNNNNVTPFDTKSLTNACMEISDIITSLDLDGNITAHASVIMFRFVTILSQQQSSETQLKIRELSLACIFVANKAQKMSKWRKLDAVLSAAYKSFYPGVQFDASKEESLVWEEKVIAAESEVLERLNHDIFCGGFSWIVTAAVESRAMDQQVANNAMAFSVSGPILAVGPDLWLAYGEEYIFTACAAFLDAKFENLITALSLIPIKVLQAAELIAASVKKSGFGKKTSIFQGSHKGLQDRLPSIKTLCAFLMSNKQGFGGQMVAMPSETALRYKIIRDRNKERRIYHNVSMALIKDSILPHIDGISAESKCNIFINKNQLNKSYDIILEGSWRAISIASYLLKETTTKDEPGNDHRLGEPDDTRMITGGDQSSIQAKGQPGLLQMNMLQDGWMGTIQSEVSNQAIWGRKTGGKCCVPGKIKESDLRRRGLRWWIPPRYGPSTTGSICDMFLVSEDDRIIEELKNLCHASQGESSAFAMLSTSRSSSTTGASSTSLADRFVAVSLHRWPSEKVAAREQSKSKRLESKKGKMSKRKVMQVGFSPGALQEMQILRQLHGLINSPQGHPNLYLPIGVALPSEEKDSDIVLSTNGFRSSIEMKRIDDDIFSLTRTSLENEAAAKKEQERKEMVNDQHLIIQPTPFVLQRFIAKKKRRDGKEEDKKSISPTIFATWCFDLLSALLHCHENGVVLRGSLNLDQIVIDHSGVAKIGSLYKSSVLSKVDKNPNNKKLVQLARQTKKESDRRKKESRKYDDDEQDEIMKDPYVPPEMLLGSPKYTMETDIWALGCLLSHLLLSKPIYTGKEKDRESLLFAMYKLVGIPAPENFELGAKFPYYKKPEKKYKPGVEKAIPKLMKDRKCDDVEAYTSAIDLIRQMLHLDPEKRITAKMALQHEYMSTYIENCNTQSFQENFVQDWMSLKKRLTKSTQDESMERERGIKRKAMLMAASKSMAAEEDDLYDMGDILGGRESKKSKA